MDILPQTTRDDLAAIVVEKLREHKIEVVLVGGSVVSMYTNNKYESDDLDFISSAAQPRITVALSELGFEAKGKDFVHPQARFTVEFPTGPVGIGNDQSVTVEHEITVKGITIKLFSPTQCVMDRLIIFFVHNDRQCLDQAVWVTEKQPVNVEEVRAWSIREGYEDKFNVFLARTQG